MQGLTYFQARNGPKRKHSGFIDSLDIKDKIAAGTQRNALCELGLKGAAQIHKLHDKVAAKFPDWRLKLKLGFNLLFYGYGSKRDILDKFGLEGCKDGGVVSVNGWAPNLTLRSLLLKLISTLRRSGQHTSKANGDARALLHIIQQEVGENCLYIIIHGLDAPSLRTAEASSVLAELAAVPNVHLVASVEHVNAPLMWDKNSASLYNWLYMDLTTFQPYVLETARLQPLLCNGRSEGEKQGAIVVLRTLVPNARQIFKILAQHQLGLEDDSGMLLHDLFKACRERFLVTNDLALRSHLNEFKDHQLIQIRRTADGAEEVFIPLLPALIEEVLTEID